MPVLKFGNDQSEHYAVLMGENGEAINQDIKSFIGPLITVKGKWARLNNWELLYVNPLKGFRVNNKQNGK